MKNITDVIIIQANIIICYTSNGDCGPTKIVRYGYCYTGYHILRPLLCRARKTISVSYIRLRKARKDI